MKSKRSSGHDGISNLLLKELSDVISHPLSIIFNCLIESGVFPDLMKIADVIPLHKSGNVHVVDNYRPISLLMTVSKILEKIMYTRVYTFLNTTNQIYMTVSMVFEANILANMQSLNW